jgi:hypothetical protein
MAMTQQQRDQAMKNIARMEQHYKIIGRPDPSAQHTAMRKRSLQSGGNAVTNAGKGLLGGMGSDIGGMIGGLLGGRAKMMGNVAKGVGRVAKGAIRDAGMGLGLLDPDQDFYDRTRETLRSQFGDERAEIYDRQMAARRAASGSGSSMSTSLRPRTRPMMSVPQSADLFDFPLTMFQNAEIQRRSPDVLGPDQGLDFFNTMMQTIPEDQLSTFSDQMYRDYLLRGGTLEFPEYILSGED